jgi:hypothetical protein
MPNGFRTYNLKEREHPVVALILMPLRLSHHEFIRIYVAEETHSIIIPCKRGYRSLPEVAESIRTSDTDFTSPYMTFRESHVAPEVYYIRLLRFGRSLLQFQPLIIYLPLEDTIMTAKGKTMRHTLKTTAITHLPYWNILPPNSTRTKCLHISSAGSQLLISSVSLIRHLEIAA